MCLRLPVATSCSDAQDCKGNLWPALDKLAAKIMFSPHAMCGIYQDAAWTYEICIQYRSFAVGIKCMQTVLKIKKGVVIVGSSTQMFNSVVHY